MEPRTFRRDPWLRTSGYHLATWSLVALVLELGHGASRLEAQGARGGWPTAALVVAGALLASHTHERRVGKMAGAAGKPVYAGTSAVWRLVGIGLGAVFAASAALPATAPASSVFPVSMIVLGIGFAQWGAGARFAWFVGLGAFLVAVGLADVAMGSHGPAARTLRLAVLGLVLPAIGIETSRRYLWFREAGR